MSLDLVMMVYALVGVLHSYPLEPPEEGTALTTFAPGNQPQWMNAWVFQLLLNLCGYASVIVPGYVLIQVVRRSRYLEKSGESSFNFMDHNTVGHDSLLVKVLPRNVESVGSRLL